MSADDGQVSTENEHEEVVLSELKAEQQFIAVGQAYGKSGEELMNFVAKRLEAWRVSETQRLARDERVQARAEKAREAELYERDAQRAHELALAEAKKGHDVVHASSHVESEASSRSTRGHRVEVPKYDEKQDVASYLDLFEAVMKKNGEEEKSWPLYLRTAVLGTKLAGSVIIEDFEDFESMKKELLLAFGTTPSVAWRELLSSKQLRRETFRQYVMRVARLAARWMKLASKESHELSSESLSILTKQVVLESVVPDLTAYLLRNVKGSSDLTEFADIGTTYQASLTTSSSQKQAPSNSSSTSKSHSKWGAEYSGTTEVFTVLADELKKLSLPERRKRALKSKLCFNCLSRGHIASDCFKKPQCNKCDRNHHPLFHDDQPISSYSCQTRSTDSSVQLMTAVAEVGGEKLRARVRVFLDLGSQASFVSTALVKAVQPVKVGSHSLLVRAFDGAEKSAVYGMYQLNITGREGRIHSVKAYEKPALNLHIKSVPASCTELWQSRGVTLSDQSVPGVPDEIHLMLGADVANSFLEQKCEFEGEHVWKTELGWVLSGPTSARHAESSMSQEPKSVAANYVHTGIERLWELEEPDARSSLLPAFPIEKVGQRYEVGLLWRSAERPADNYAQAMARATRLLEKLQRQGKREMYDDVLMKEYLDLGAIELEPEPDTAGYYMPHHAVFRSESTTTKTRVVFNASAASAGNESLNALLDPGPSLLPSLTGLLIRFREQPVAVQADIRKAFFMIGVKEADRRYIRFIWPDASGEMKVWRLARVPFGVSCSPFLLSAVLRRHIDDAIENASKGEKQVLILLRESLYVDDCVASLPGKSIAQEFKGVSVACLGTAGMDLRKWKSNAELSEGVVQANGKVLGLQWDAVKDQLKVSTPTADVDPSTKRHLLHCVASFFDPVGFISPYVLKGKIFLQELWKLGVGWDDPIPDRLQSAIRLWWGERASVDHLAWPRYLACEDDVTVHLFTDASEKGFGCCVYIVSVNGGSELIFSKAKVAPTKQRSLAQLELQAAFTGVQWLESVMSEMRLPIREVHAWTDSMTALSWIAGPPHRWKTFVANRVARIQDIGNKLQIKWHHCPGKENPADLASRGASIDDLQQDLWRHGPLWLPDKDKWPATQTPVSAEAAKEARVNVVSVAPEELPWWLQLSKWSRVMGVAKCLLKWQPKSRPALTAPELERRAEALVYRLVQSHLFPEETRDLRANHPISRTSKLHQYQPFLDDLGVMRVGGRLSQSKLDYEAKHPVLLAKHHVTDLILMNIHEQSFHQGVETVLTTVRQTYWILGDRRILRSIKSRCGKCRRFDARPADEASPPLPPDRVVYQRPFGVSGVDYAGPLMVRDGGKAWIVLFVCSTTRAVHIDLVRSLEASDFLLVYRRFVARWGEPHRIRSDNGTCFKAAAKNLPVEWLFNPPAAPWFGGFFERMVGSVKRPLIKVLGRAYVHEKELRTLLCEIESAVNSRPLTHVGDFESETPLTPAMLCGKIWFNQDAQEEPEVQPGQLEKRKRYISSVSEHLVNRWRHEYLITLNAYSSGRSSPPSVGDVVIVADDSKRKQHWRLARVIKLFPGRDGRARVAELRVKAGTDSRATMLRPIRRLVPLEVVDRSAAVTAEPRRAEAVPNAADEPTRTRTRIINPPVRY